MKTLPPPHFLLVWIHWRTFSKRNLQISKVTTSCFPKWQWPYLSFWECCLLFQMDMDYFSSFGGFFVTPLELRKTTFILSLNNLKITHTDSLATARFDKSVSNFMQPLCAHDHLCLYLCLPFLHSDGINKTSHFKSTTAWMISHYISIS